MSKSESDYAKLLLRYSEIQKKNIGSTIPEHKKKEIDDLIESGMLFKEIGLHTDLYAGDITGEQKRNGVKERKLEIVSIESVIINPDEPVYYTKETQTVTEISSNVHSENASPRIGGVMSPKFLTALEWDDEFEMTFEEKADNSVDFHMGLKEDSVNNIGKRKVAELTEGEKSEILSSDVFLDFFDKASCIIEHTLKNNVDIFADYAGNYEDDKNRTNTGNIIELNRSLFDDRWSWNRVVTSLCWSPHYQEQLLASYFSNEAVSHEPDGVCLIWNVKSKQSSPEYVLHYQSSIICSMFSKYHPSLVVGGTYSGQIVIWDIRSNKRTPVQRTLLSATAHTHPVINLTNIGSQNADSLISLSTDGKMCSWRMEMLNQPLEAIQLVNTKSKEINSLCMEVSNTDQNKFFVGAEDGSVYMGSRIGSKPGECQLMEGNVHQGPVMSVSLQKVPFSDNSDLFLTSSVDYSVKLWSNSEQISSNLIFTLDDRSDYVYDVDWSPIHPTVFCNIDGSGKLEVWNLLTTSEEPIAKAVLDSQSAINRCKWHNSGSVIASGDDIGHVRILNVNEHSVQLRNVDWQEFDNLINQLHFDTESSAPLKDIAF